MRFIGFVILFCVGAMMLGRHHVVSFDFAQAQTERDRMRYEHDPVWDTRTAQHDFYPPAQTFPPGYSNEQQIIRFHTDNYPQGGFNDGWETEFHWPQFSMAIVMLIGGTLVCRRIFTSPAARSRPIQLQYRNRATVPPARPRPAVAVDRVCPRADCGRTNPPMAKFCRRCGSALNEA
jgi:hypothetical protein